MNQKQREVISDIIAKLEDIEGEEREKRENAPEGLYDSERYERMEEIADTISEAIDLLREVDG